LGRLDCKYRKRLALEGAMFIGVSKSQDDW